MNAINKEKHQPVPEKSHKQAPKQSPLLIQLLQQSQHLQVPPAALHQVMVEAMLHPKAHQLQQQAHLLMGHLPQPLHPLEEAILHPKVPLLQAHLRQLLVYIRLPIHQHQPLQHLVIIPIQTKHLLHLHHHLKKSQPHLHGRHLLAQHHHGRNQ